MTNISSYIYLPAFRPAGAAKGTELISAHRHHLLQMIGVSPCQNGGVDKIGGIGGTTAGGVIPVIL